MRIKVIRAFWDKEDKTAKKPVPIGKVLTVSADRGAQLIDLRLADPVPEKSSAKTDPAPTNS